MNKSKTQEINLADLLSNSKEDSGFIITDTILTLNGEITPEMSLDIVGYITEANFPPNDIPQLPSINLIINSQGGCMHSSFAIISAMRASTIPIYTVAMGACASGALMIAISGDIRLVDKYCSIMSHTLSTGYPEYAKPADLQLWLDDVHVSKQHIVNLYQDNTKLDQESITKYLLRENGDTYLTAEQAIKYNLFDNYFTSFGQLGKGV